MSLFAAGHRQARQSNPLCNCILFLQPSENQFCSLKLKTATTRICTKELRIKLIFHFVIFIISADV